MKSKGPITTHVLDVSRGKAAANILVRLERFSPNGSKGGWSEIGRGETNVDGRVENLLAPDTALILGIYRLNFETGTYFGSMGVTGFYPEVSIQFQVSQEKEHYHVPLLLSPFGYSTYRGT